jgi:prolyl-tRNA synthetase
MRWTQTLIPTQKETPADAKIISHQLLIRAGFIRQLTAGVFDFLPLGLRSLRKAEQIVREEMNNIGASEVMLPALQPLSLWQETGRDKSYGDNLFRMKDRHGATTVLGPTHEEVITELVRAYINSYKQMPLSLYQIQTKFRDEFRPRFGLLRVREFVMKDAYSFHSTQESLDATYTDMYGAYEKIFQRCGVPVSPVEADSGPIGGSASHEFMATCEAGEDTLLISDQGNYAANVEKCEIGTRSANLSGAPTGELTRIHTPGLPGIDDVAAFLKIPASQMLKTLVYSVTSPASQDRTENMASPKWVVAVVRGDHDVNEAKLKRIAMDAFNVAQVELLDNPSVRASWAIGFVGPDKAVNDQETVVAIDFDAAQPGDWCTGANAVDHHVTHFNWFRDCGDKLADPKKVRAADIRNAVAGDPSPKNDGGKLIAKKGIELGHVFKLGTKYSVALKANFKDEKQKEHPIIMGCYGIGVGRILIAAAEAFSDDKGLAWPASIAPFQVVITPIKYDGDVMTAADALYSQLHSIGIDALLDDRDQRPGVKFADADLIGFPVRITIGDRGLKEGVYEVKARKAAEASMVKQADLIEHVKGLLK